VQVDGLYTQKELSSGSVIRWMFKKIQAIIYFSLLFIQVTTTAQVEGRMSKPQFRRTCGMGGKVLVIFLNVIFYKSLY
jgi:hypothetical protein